MQQQIYFGVAQATREQRRDALALLKQEFMSLFTGPEVPMRWNGTRTQLFEMIYLIYIEDMLLTDDGCPLTLRAISTMTCLRFGERLASNPCAYIYKSRARKDIRSRSFFDIYVHFYTNGYTQPLKQFYTTI